MIGKSHLFPLMTDITCSSLPFMNRIWWDFWENLSC